MIFSRRLARKKFNVLPDCRAPRNKSGHPPRTAGWYEHLFWERKRFCRKITAPNFDRRENEVCLSVWFLLSTQSHLWGPPRAALSGGGLAQTPRSAHPYKELRPHWHIFWGSLYKELTATNELQVFRFLGESQ